MSEQHRERYSEAIRAAEHEGRDDFQAWFDRSSGERESALRGYWDFALHVLTPAVCERLAQPESGVALEIGYGGGRLLNAACKYFGEAVGIDVHGEASSVETFLRDHGNDNFRLLRTDGERIELPDASVDFVYSFIVLQHVQSFSAFRSYVHEASRCLRPGGVAQLYYGAWSTARSRFSRSGYRELPDAPVNHISLLVRPHAARRTLREAGLHLVDSGVSYKRVPDGYRGSRGGQAYVTAVKPG